MTDGANAGPFLVYTSHDTQIQVIDMAGNQFKFPRSVFSITMAGRNEPPDRPPRPPTDSEPLSKLRYFHPHLINMEQVRDMLYPHLRDNGHFLVRISTNQVKTYTVSVVHNQGIKHFRILTKQGQYYLQDQRFPSIDELIMYYGSREVPNMERIKGVRLLFPILRSDPLPATASRPPRASRGTSLTSQGSSFDEDTDNLKYDRVFPSRNSIRKLPPPPTSSGFELRKTRTPRLRYDSEPEPRRSTIGQQIRDRARSDNLDERPPAPIPEVENERSGSSNGIYNGIYYSCIKQIQKNKLPELIQALKVNPQDETHCECGLDLELSQLPQGWSVHVSREADSGYGRPFFMSPDQQTSWDLPRDVYLELNRHQQKFIKFLCDNYRDGKPPPDEHTQIQWSSSSSSGGLSEAMQGAASTMGGAEAAFQAKRDSTGSNTGASGQQGGGYTGRGLGEDASGATEATTNVVIL